jgi:hypothetical protein
LTVRRDPCGPSTRDRSTNRVIRCDAAAVRGPCCRTSAPRFQEGRQRSGATPGLGAEAETGARYTPSVYLGTRLPGIS